MERRGDFYPGLIASNHTIALNQSLAEQTSPLEVKVILETAGEFSWYVRVQAGNYFQQAHYSSRDAAEAKQREILQALEQGHYKAKIGVVNLEFI